MSIDANGQHLWQEITPTRRAAFLGALVAGFCIHLYAFTNLIPNSDGLSRVFDHQQMTVSGRWFLHYASTLNTFTQMPMVIGLLSLLFMAMSAVLVVDLLRLRSVFLSGLAGVLMTAFPCLGYTFLYMFTASAYCLAIFLAVLSVWLARRGKLMGVLLLALSMGTYQAYVTVAITLSLLVVFREILEPSASFSETLRLGLRLMAYLAAGAVLYYVVLVIFLRVKDLELLDYLGMSTASAGYPFGQLPALILRCYKQVVAFFFLPGSAGSFTSVLMAILDLEALVVGVGCLLAVARARGLFKELWRPLGALAMAALLPLGMNFGQILSPYSVPTPLMKYAFVSVYLLMLMAVDTADCSKLRAQTIIGLFNVTFVWAVLLLLFCLNTNNLLYTASAQAHRATESYATRLLARIEACPGYEPGMDIAIVGAVPAEQLHSDIDSYWLVDHYSVPLHSVIPLNKHIYYYFNDWLNTPVAELSEETMIAISDSPEFQAMPLYPAQGSVQVLDGRVVVRIAERYTPKSAFELEYENRR